MISVCVLVLVWPGIATGNVALFRQIPLSKSCHMDARWAPCQGGGGGGKALPTLQTLLRKSCQGISVKTGKSGRSVSEVVEQRWSWAELSSREGERSTVGKAGPWCWECRSSSNKCLPLEAQGGEELGDFHVDRVWLGFYGAVTMPVSGLWRAFFNSASAQAASSAPVTPLSGKTSVLLTEIQMIFAVSLAKQEYLCKKKNEMWERSFKMKAESLSWRQC